jgi:predicted RNase H-like HicB family nuclease
MQYAIVIEKAPGSSNYSAYVPALPGCVAAAESSPKSSNSCRKLSKFT